MSRRTLVDLAQRHCGCAFKEGQRGVDLGVPIFAKEPLMLLVQVKNRQDQQSPDKDSSEACLKMLPSYAFNRSDIDSKNLPTWDKNCVLLYMQLGAAQASVVFEGPKLTNPLQIYGLSARCLSNEVLKALKVLLQGQVNLERFLREFRVSDDTNEVWPNYLKAHHKSWPFVNDKKFAHPDFNVEDRSVRKRRRSSTIMEVAVPKGLKVQQVSRIKIVLYSFESKTRENHTNSFPSRK